MVATTVVNGSVTYPNNIKPTSCKVSFALSSVQKDTDILLPDEVIVDANASTGDFTVSLWPNLNGSYYTVTASAYEDNEYDGVMEETWKVGDISVPSAGPVEIDTLIVVAPDPGVVADSAAAAEASSVEARAQRILAETARAGSEAASGLAEDHRDAALAAANASGAAFYLTHAAATAATWAEGDKVQVYYDETRDSRHTLYTYTSGALVFGDYLDRRYEVWVEDHRATGFTDAQTINAALSYMNTQNMYGATLHFSPRRVYTIDGTGYLYNLNNLTLEFNGATLKRANGSTTSSTLAADISVSALTFDVAAAPSSWAVGDYLTAFSGTSDANTSRDPRRITAISGNTITISSGFGDFGAFDSDNDITSGTTIAKNFQMIAGRPSTTDAGSPLTAGINAGFRMRNGTFDGNGANQLNNSWRFLAEYAVHSDAGDVSEMLFKDTAGECGVGHGLVITENRFENLAGSCFHTSMHDDNLANSSTTIFAKNIVDTVNTAGDAAVGHSEGAITFSWGGGNLIVSQNQFKNGSESIMGGMGASSDANGDRHVIFTDNICENFTSIFNSISTTTEGLIISNNLLKDCGDNSAMLDALLVNGTCAVAGNIPIGSTNLGGAARDVRSLVSGAEAIEAAHQNAIHWVRGRLAADETGVTSTTHTGLAASVDVVERAGAAITSYLTDNAGYAGRSFYHPSAPASTGGAMDFYDAASKSMYYRIYGASGGQRWQDDTGSDLLRLFKNDPLELRGGTWGLAFQDHDVAGNFVIAPNGTSLGIYISTGVGTRTKLCDIEADGDITLTQAGKGFIAVSPDGLTTKRIGIDNSGNVAATAV